ncbi:hypothetical protein CBF23_010930 [Marinomonas agarivorans]|nr:hypothetical protein CBF23_010930 [Marinomonas agarivorans]
MYTQIKKEARHQRASLLNSISQTSSTFYKQNADLKRTNLAVQRMDQKQEPIEMYLADRKNELMTTIFKQRIIDKTATTGDHNYALDTETGRVVRSCTSGHAEILLLAMSSAKAGEEVHLVSEYKPCSWCQNQIAQIQQARGIRVVVSYYLDYDEKGDGDVNATREFYRNKKYLSGGGQYNYQVKQ